MSKLPTFDEALAVVLSSHPSPPAPTPLEKGEGETRNVGTIRARGKVLAEDLFAPFDLPRFDASAVDGYALAEISQTAQLVGESAAGKPWPNRLESGDCVRIFTGAEIPKGTVAVVMQEDCELKNNTVALKSLPRIGSHIRKQGEEIRTGEVALQRGTGISPAAQAVAASFGMKSVKAARIRVGILITGAEIQPLWHTPWPELKEGHIFESNSVALMSTLGQEGVSDLELAYCGDDREETRKQLEKLLEKSNIVITSGGVSVGDHDLVRPVLKEMGAEFVVEGVAIKPGKPFCMAKLQDKVIFGLPGNPVSCLVTFHLFVVPYLRKALGLPQIEPIQAFLKGDLTKHGDRREFVPGKISYGGGRVFFEPVSGRASHKPTCLVGMDALGVVFEDDHRYETGKLLDIIPILGGF